MRLIDDTFNFVKELDKHFLFDLSGSDHIWNVLYPDSEKKWHHLNVIKYRNTFFINHINSDVEGLEVEPGKRVNVLNLFNINSHSIDENEQLSSFWEPLISYARRWLKRVDKDWIKANKIVNNEYPIQYRYGIVPNFLIRSSLPGIYRIDKELKKQKTRKFISLVESGFFLNDKNTMVQQLNADEYFRYCKIAYIEGKRKGERIDESMSGAEMYKKYADGRHEGLLDIDRNSYKEFADWIDGKHPKRKTGGHPWEIKRGGNTTHIDLSVYRPSFSQGEGYRVELLGESFTRLAETVRMFLGIQKKGMPVSIANPESIRKRLLGQDNIGIIPSYIFPHRANQRFNREKDVFDVMYYDDLGRYKRRINPFIAWEPLPILKPSDL